MIDPSNAERDPIYLEAADWLIRLRQPDLSLGQTLAWRQWLAQDPRHRLAFHDLEEVWNKLDTVPTPSRPAPEALDADTYDGSVSVSAWSQQHSPATSRHRLRWALVATLLLTLMFIGFGSVAPSLMSTLARHKAKIFETAVGQNATVRLSDGSEVQLGGHTRLTVSLGRRRRQVDLQSGEAFFSVAKDPVRPFLVRAGTATITALGTDFNIRRSDDRVIVSVLEGRVLVQPMAPILPITWIPPSRAVGPAKPVSSGQRSTVTGHGTQSTQTVGDASSAVAWQQGRLAFEAEPLRYVVQDVNRYADKPIVIGDAQTGDLRVTGTVGEANIIGWVGSLQAAFGIRADIQPDRIVLRQQ